MFQFVELERSDPVAILRLNRPPVNALDATALQELAAAIQQIEDDPAIRAVIITSVITDIFCVGGDLKYWPRRYPRQPRVVVEAGRGLFEQMERLTKPSIASINGHVIGDGLSLALACDIRIVAEGARFQLPEINYGFIPGWGTLGRVIRAVGPTLAAELLLVGDPIDARRAQAIGLVNQVTTPDNLQSTTQAMALRLASKPPRTMRYAKAALRGAFNDSSTEQTEWEASCFEAVWGSPEWEQGIRNLFGTIAAPESH